MLLYIAVVFFVFTRCLCIASGTPLDLKNDDSNNNDINLEPTPIEPLPRQKRLADEESISPCQSKFQMDSLYRVKHEGTWRTVVTIPSIDFVQKVRIETCLNPGQPCPGGIGKLPGIESRCKQMFTDLTFLVYKGENETEIIEASIPTYCACSIEPTASFNCVINVSQSCSQIDQLEPEPHKSSDVIGPVTIPVTHSSRNYDTTPKLSKPSSSAVATWDNMLSVLAFSLTFLIYVGID